MKRLIALVLAAGLMLSLSGCCCCGGVPEQLTDRLQGLFPPKAEQDQTQDEATTVTTVGDTDEPSLDYEDALPGVVPDDGLAGDQQPAQTVPQQTAPQHAAPDNTPSPTAPKVTTVRTKTTTTKTTTTHSVDGPINFGPIALRTGTTPLEKGLNFGGKTFSFANYGSSWDRDHDDWYNSFQKKYNVKLDIQGVPTLEYTAALASAMAAGSPYDIVFLYGFDYPSQITANVMAPLNDYLTTADLWKTGSAANGGFSKSLMQAHSLNGNIYCVAGNYLQTPAVLWYNKKMFADAGYSGAQDPLALYKAGKWSWDALYDMLYEIQAPDKGLYGINSIAPYYCHAFINSFDTDFAKMTGDSRLVQNLNDPNLYLALEMLQKYSYGEYKVTDPKNQFENGLDQFLNGTTASVLNTGGAYWNFYNSMSSKTYSAFGTKAQQLGNLGGVPLPCKNGVHPVWEWMGYGAGNGATEDGILCALAYAKYDSTVNHKQAYHPNMPAEMKSVLCGVLDSDKLRGPMSGFRSSAGSLGSMAATIASKTALNGENITVVLKAYQKQAQMIIDQTLKG